MQINKNSKQSRVFFSYNQHPVALQYFAWLKKKEGTLLSLVRSGCCTTRLCSLE